MNDDTPRAPPVEVWFQILIVVQFMYFGVGVFFADDSLRGPRSAFAQFNRERIAAFAAAEPDGLIAIGNSTLKTAVPDWTERRPDDPAPPVLRIVDDHAFFDAFEALIDDVIAARPRAVILQALMLQSQPGWRTSLARFRIAQTAWLTGTDDVQHVQFGDVCPLTDRRSVAELGPNTRAAQIAEHREWWSTMASRDVEADVPRRARAAVERFAAAGIPVVIVELPQTAALFEPQPAASLHAVVEALDAAHAQVHAVAVPQQDDALFCDHRHFSDAGGDAVWEWLGPRVVDALR